MKPYKLLLLSSLFTVVVLPVGAQGTAFSYQGRLNDNGSPANGIYDLQFTVCDALTNGNFVAGPITDSATGVSNGLFCVSLDFGNGVFTSPNRWLEVAARTNGATAFTTLAPRQALTAVPYAVYAAGAGSAAGVSGSVSASQISGTLALVQLPGAVLTNNEQGVSLTGNLIGNATTATTAGAVSSSGIDDASLDNQLWMYAKADSLEDNLNVARYAWTNTIAKLQRGKAIRIQLDGTGLANYLLDPFIYNLTNRIPFAGMLNGGVPPWGFSGFISTGAAGQSLGKDGFWYPPYYYTSARGGTLTARGVEFPWNVIEVDYITYPLGSSFAVQTNNNAGGVYGNCSGTISTVGAASRGTSWFWTNSAGPRQLGIQFVALSNGTNRIVSIGVWNNMVTNGFILGAQTQGGSHVFDELAVPTNITAPIYRAWHPDIILWQSVESAAIVSTYLPAWVNFYQTTLTNCDLVLCGTYPSANADQALQGTETENIAMAAHCSYFDGYSPFEGTNTMILRGLWGDGIHNPGAYPIYGFWLYRWLDFQDFYLEGGMTTANAITRGITTNILVGRHTFYYTNGILELVK